MSGVRLADGGLVACDRGFRQDLEHSDIETGPEGGGPFPTPARWSPDGGQIVFECRNEGNDDVCIAPASGGAVRRLTQHPASDALPSWSHGLSVTPDGRRLLFAAAEYRDGNLYMVESFR